MKIKTTTYQFITDTKRDKRLCIGIDIELPDGAILNTGAIVQLHPIAYFANKVPEETFGMLFLSAIVMLLIVLSKGSSILSMGGQGNLMLTSKFHSLQYFNRIKRRLIRCCLF